MSEKRLKLSEKYRSILARLSPLGALGASLILGAAAPAAANVPKVPAAPPPAAIVEPAPVSERLEAIREAVSAATRRESRDERLLAWGNWGWGWPNWNNWHNWRNWGNWFRNF